MILFPYSKGTDEKAQAIPLRTGNAIVMYESEAISRKWIYQLNKSVQFVLCRYKPRRVCLAH